MSWGSASTTSQRSWKPRSRRVIPVASRTNELAPSAPTSHRALTVRVSPVERKPAGLLLLNPPKRQLDALIAVDQPRGFPSALDGHARQVARVPVDRALQLRLEEHVVRLPARPRRAVRLEPHEQLAVGPEPLVVVHRDHLLGEHLGQSKRLQQTHDLVVQMDGAREAVDLLEALEHAHPMTGSPQQRGQRLAHRAVTDDRHVEVEIALPGSPSATSLASY